MGKVILKEEVFEIIGICMEVHRQSGKGIQEIVHKDAHEYELHLKNHLYESEKEFPIRYKKIVLSHKFYPDFVIFDRIILEVKSCSAIPGEFVAQTLNYLTASKLRVGMIAHFGKSSLEYKRIIL